MNSSEFITILSETYNEPIIKDNKPNIKLKFIKKWIEETFKQEQLEIILEKVIKQFKPTSINPCPLIPHIEDIVYKDKPDYEVESKEAATRIIGAVVKFGQYNETEAEKYIGTLGWEAVKRYGGWQHICQITEYDNNTTFYAQLKESIKSLYLRQVRGKKEPPSLPQENPKLLELIKNTEVYKKKI